MRSTKRARAALKEWTVEDERLADIDPNYLAWHRERARGRQVIHSIGGDELTELLMNELTWTRRALFVVSMSLLTLLTVQIRAVLWLIPACINVFNRARLIVKELRHEDEQSWDTDTE
jgi:hypothetical protein